MVVREIYNKDDNDSQKSEDSWKIPSVQRKLCEKGLF